MMMSEEPQITIEDIDCPTLRMQLKAAVEDLTQLCPSDATVRATFRRIQDRFLADIRVVSENVYMSAVGQASALNELLDHIHGKMLSQIVDWRAHRFAS